MVVRRRRVEKLARLEAREANWRPSAHHCEGRDERDAGRMFSKSKEGGAIGLGCSQHMALSFSTATPLSSAATHSRRQSPLSPGSNVNSD